MSFLNRDRSRYAIGVGLMLLLAGCAAGVHDTEHRLANAGFVGQPADTPQAEAQLAQLPAHKLMRRPNAGGDDTVEYIYADPEQCHCTYTGTPQAYAEYRRAEAEQKAADAAEERSRLEPAADANWPMWHPSFW